MGQTANPFGVSELPVPSLSQVCPNLSQLGTKTVIITPFSYEASVDAGASDTRTTMAKRPVLQNI